MTILQSTDFFPSGVSPVAIEPRIPQPEFPEHHHDFHEIVIVERGVPAFMSLTASRIPSAVARCASCATTIATFMNTPTTCA